MKVIVDTDVWSEAFRKKGEKTAYVDELKNLIQEGRIEMIGVIRMENLSGIRHRTKFETLQKLLAAFPDRHLDSKVFETAAQFLNLCRSKGVRGSNNDFIISACSMFWKLPILTKDQDFLHYQKWLPIELIQSRNQ